MALHRPVEFTPFFGRRYASEGLSRLGLRPSAKETSEYARMVGLGATCLKSTNLICGAPKKRIRGSAAGRTSSPARLAEYSVTYFLFLAS